MYTLYEVLSIYNRVYYHHAERDATTRLRLYGDNEAILQTDAVLLFPRAQARLSDVRRRRTLNSG